MATRTEPADSASLAETPLLPGRAGFIREAEASWEKFQRDGLHITGEELENWLGNWGTGVAAPACHV